MSVSTKPGATTLAVIDAAAELAGERPGHADEAGLRRRVVHLAAGAGEADDRADEDDAAALRARSIPLAQRRTTRNVPARLASTTDANASSDIVSARPSRVMPALATSTLDRTEALLDLGDGGVDLRGVGLVAAHGGEALDVAAPRRDGDGVARRRPGRGRRPGRCRGCRR